MRKRIKARAVRSKFRVKLFGTSAENVIKEGQQLTEYDVFLNQETLHIGNFRYERKLYFVAYMFEPHLSVKLCVEV